MAKRQKLKLVIFIQKQGAVVMYQQLTLTSYDPWVISRLWWHRIGAMMMANETEKQETDTTVGGLIDPAVINRQQAIEIFFQAIDHYDPYWTDLVEDHLVFNDDDVIAWPSQYDVGRALGFTDSEMETAEGLEQGRLKELGL